MDMDDLMQLEFAIELNRQHDANPAVSSQFYSIKRLRHPYHRLPNLCGYNVNNMIYKLIKARFCQKTVKAECKLSSQDLHFPSSSYFHLRRLGSH